MIRGNRSKDSKETLVAGLFDCSPVEHNGRFLINPTQDELDSAGISSRARQRFQYDMNDRYPVGYSVVDIWHSFVYKDSTFYLPLTFTITPQNVQSSRTGKLQWVNNKLQTTWAHTTEDIASDNSGKEGWMQFNLADAMDPRALKDDELTFLHYITAIGRFKPSDKDFVIEPFPSDAWEAMIAGDVSYLQEVLSILKREARSLDLDFRVRMAVGVNMKTQRMEFYKKYSYAPHGQNDLTPFLYAGQTVQLGDAFALRLRDISKKEYRANPKAFEGQYSWTGTHLFNFRPQEVVLELPDLSSHRVSDDFPAEEPYAANQAVSTDNL